MKELHRMLSERNLIPSQIMAAEAMLNYCGEEAIQEMKDWVVQQKELKTGKMMEKAFEIAKNHGMTRQTFYH